MARSITGTSIDVDIAGNVYVLDATRNVLTLYDSTLRRVATVGGSGWGDTQFDHPVALWARNGIDVFVADEGNHRIQRFDRGLSPVSSLSTRGGSRTEERFGYPAGVAVSRLGTLYLIDGENRRVLAVNRENRLERAFGDYTSGAGRLRAPREIAIGPDDRVYVLDGRRVAMFDLFGNWLGEPLAGIVSRPANLYADDLGLLVIDADTLYARDREGRFGRPTALTPWTAGLVVNGMATRGGRLYLLTIEGIRVAPDPRMASGVDTERRSR
jgi:DNA-binding beta-propeller fold protein YncE